MPQDFQDYGSLQGRAKFGPDSSKAHGQGIYWAYKDLLSSYEKKGGASQ